MQRWARNLAAVGVLVVAVVCLAGFRLPGSSTEKVTASGSVVRIPAGTLRDTARYFSFTDQGSEIRFFLVKGSDGALRSAFDACDVCYRDKKGYQQKGAQMICRNCGKGFAIDRIGPHAVGGCNPAYLPYQLQGSDVVIKVEDLRAGRKYF